MIILRDVRKWCQTEIPHKRRWCILYGVLDLYSSPLVISVASISIPLSWKAYDNIFSSIKSSNALMRSLYFLNVFRFVEVMESCIRFLLHLISLSSFLIARVFLCSLLRIHISELKLLKEGIYIIHLLAA